MSSFMALVNWFKPNWKKARAISAKEQTAQICVWRMTQGYMGSPAPHRRGLNQYAVHYKPEWPMWSLLSCGHFQAIQAQHCVWTRLEVVQAGLGYPITSMSSVH